LQAEVNSEESEFRVQAVVLACESGLVEPGDT
jgi:hypothetical protein